MKDFTLQITILIPCKEEQECVMEIERVKASLIHRKDADVYASVMKNIVEKGQYTNGTDLEILD